RAQALSIRRAVSCVSTMDLLRWRETVAAETFAALATSRMVAGPFDMGEKLAHETDFVNRFHSRSPLIIRPIGSVRRRPLSRQTTRPQARQIDRARQRRDPEAGRPVRLISQRQAAPGLRQRQRGGEHNAEDEA